MAASNSIDLDVITRKLPAAPVPNAALPPFTRVDVHLSNGSPCSVWGMPLPRR
jgi:hypothetical protein